jgi:hypothetical protein
MDGGSIMNEVVISPDSMNRMQELALRPQIDGKFRSINSVSQAMKTLLLCEMSEDSYVSF